LLSQEIKKYILQNIPSKSETTPRDLEKTIREISYRIDSIGDGNSIWLILVSVSNYNLKQNQDKKTRKPDELLDQDKKRRK